MRILLLITWAALTGLCSFLSYRTCCQNDGATGDIETINYSDTFTLTGEDGWTVTCPSGRFLRSSNELLSPTDQLQECLNAIADYQKEHPGQKWNIIGNYSVEEENATIFRNLGEARAQQIKKVITERFDVSPALLTIKGNIVDSLAYTADTLLYGYSIALGTPPRPAETESPTSQTEDAETAATYSEDKEVQAPTNRFDRTKPIFLRFATNSTIPIMNTQIRDQFADLIADLDNDDTVSVKVTGHTDTQGEPEYNIRLGMDRAQSIKDYLVRNGLAGNRILIDSKGESMPISDQDEINRRVEVTIE